MDLEASFGEFSVDQAKRSFLEDEPWQSARRFLERLRATSDWGEIIIAANVCFEPVVGILIRRELLMRSVRFNGDMVTQAINHVAQLEWEWVRDWTVDLVRFVLEDETHGAANAEIVAGWLADWLPAAHEAADALEPVFDRLPAGIPFADARQNVQIDVDEMHSSCGVTELSRRGRG
jgi:hypothetical protein